MSVRMMDHVSSGEVKLEYNEDLEAWACFYMLEPITESPYAHLALALMIRNVLGSTFIVEDKYRCVKFTPRLSDRWVVWYDATLFDVPDRDPVTVLNSVATHSVVDSLDVMCDWIVNTFFKEEIEHGRKIQNLQNR